MNEWKSIRDILPKIAEDIELMTPEQEIVSRNSVRELPRNDYDCPICLNKEVVYKLVDGEIKGIWCKCKNTRDYKDRARKSGMGELLKLSLDDYAIEEEWQNNVKKRAEEYLVLNSSSWFVALGQVGSGKTTICSAIANSLMKKQNVMYIVWNDYMEKIRRLRGDELEDYRESVRYVDVLYLDDMLKFNNQMELSELFSLVNYRYNNHKRMIISSEKSFQELMSIDEGIASRIYERAGDYMITLKKDKARNQRMKGLEI